MKRNGLTFLGLSLSAALFASSMLTPSAHGQSLRDALAKTYLENPTLLSARANLRSTDEAVPQALSNWRPSVEVAGDISRNHTDLSTRTDPTQTRTPRGVGLDIRQNIFRGFRTVAAVDKAELDVQAQRARLRGTEQNVLLSTVTAYVAVVRDEAVLRLNINNEEVLRRQLQATRDRFSVGEITRTDVSQAEARLSGATADRIQAEGNLKISRANFENAVGVAPGRLASPPPLSGLPASVQEAVNKARGNHPDVVAAGYVERASLQTVKSVRGELLPTLTVTGSLDQRYEFSTNNNRQDSAEIQLDLSVPLYQRGAVYSRLREAKQDAGRSRLDLETSKRDVIEAATDAWETLVTARARIKSFQAQIAANEIALDGVRREAAVGSRTVLDVLDAEQELLDSRVSLVRAERDEVVASYELKSAVGDLSAANLSLPVEIYNPLGHYNEVREKIAGGSSSGQGDVEGSESMTRSMKAK